MTLDTTVSNRDAPSVQGHADTATYEHLPYIHNGSELSTAVR